MRLPRSFPGRLSWPLPVVLIVTLAGCSKDVATETAGWQERPPLEVDVAAVQQAPIRETLEFSGSLIPLRFANIAAEVDGVIVEIPAAEEEIEYELNGQTVSRPITLDIGHRVREGQVLVRIDETDYRLALEAARAKLALAENEQAKLRVWRREEEKRQLQAQYEEAEAIWQRSEKDKLRVQTLFEKQTVSREELDRVLTAGAVARAVMERAKAAWEVAKTGPTKEELAIAAANVQLAQAEVNIRAEKLARCTIRAPYDGVIVDRYVSKGDRVTAGANAQIMQIVDPSILFAQVAVPARYQGRIRVGDLARLRVQGVTDLAAGGGQQDFAPAVVGLINDKIDPATRTFRVRVGIENPAGLFKPGTFAEVELTIRSVPQAVVVPHNAITFADGQPAVFVLDGQCVRRRPVQLGIVSRDRKDRRRDLCEIREGLSVGQQVVVGDATAILADEMLVRVRQPAPAASLGKSASSGESVSFAGQPADRIATASPVEDPR